ncbi:hypothetical protein [Anaerosacchariphilus polymeriproducens]|uniref:Uncharacterized protein n=1 Tax=Anaerosacchariphilus polymeriproducens TaxID=1812858 RepID=A0A371ARU9_9FIRM|nr:hypothetical protein [Anaerosacchariphilus polymeriproducens]RDU22200.1 hypothetical protein DWV06_16885 [Anaerosacchariphilus polymeriproducens]
MARPTKEMELRKETEATILKALKLNHTDEKYLRDQVDEYMKFYDNLARINAKLEKDLEIELLKEKRQITKEMRSILLFLGLKPEEQGAGTIEAL